MSNLSPEPRADKDGKVVTRWVRNNSSSPVKAIPAPQVSSPVKVTASPETLADLKSFMKEYGITGRFEQSLTRMIAFMPEDIAGKLVSDMHTDYFALGNVEAVHDMLDSVYGVLSRIDREHRATVFSNLRSIIPEYSMTDEDPEIISKTRIVFDAIGGYSLNRPFTEDEKNAYQSAACVIVSINIQPHTDKEVLAQAGLVRNHKGRLSLAGREAVDTLLEHVKHIDSIREELMERQAFNADLIREIASGGALGKGAL